jgi:hypothetical protein
MTFYYPFMAVVFVLSGWVYAQHLSPAENKSQDETQLTANEPPARFIYSSVCSFEGSLDFPTQVNCSATLGVERDGVTVARALK